MSHKLVSPPFKLCSSASMSGVTVFISSVTSILYRDSLAYQCAWSGNPTGTFDVQGSVDFNLGLPESGGGLNAGTWTSITLSATVSAAGTPSTALINLSQLAFPYIRLQYTNSTGSGSLGVSTSGKSYG